MSVRVLIVDDSVTMRRTIAAVLRRDPQIEVVGEAAEPHAARAAIKALNPDVITLDVEMPGMNGLEFLDRIMRLRPMPVVMVSTLTHAGSEAAIAALELGAVDIVGKPDGSSEAEREFAALPSKVRAAARARLNARRSTPGVIPQARFEPAGDCVVAIGASTGGVEALLAVIAHLPSNCPPILITQHMPAAFTVGFAARLDRASKAHVAEARDGEPLENGRVYLAPGGRAHLQITGGQNPRCALVEGEAINGHRPSIDALFHSVAASRRPAVGVILTGMGKDGAAGLLAMRTAGAATIGQDESSSVIYGMPRAAFELGAVERQLPLSRIAPALLAATAAYSRSS